LDVIASLIINIKLQSQIINFLNESLQSLLWQGFKRIPFKGNTTFATLILKKSGFLLLNAHFLFIYCSFIAKKRLHAFKNKGL